MPAIDRPLSDCRYEELNIDAKVGLAVANDHTHTAELIDL